MSRPTAKDVAREFQETSRHKMPPILGSHRESFLRMLGAKLRQVDETVSKLKAIAQREPDDYVRGQLLFWRHMRSGVKTLIKETKQRRGMNNASRTR